ncbi:MAG TPA: hypothetical protein VHN19_04690 [Burkholderiales bacterium]|jgi:hypothetical protein|nr:hypothetical protein [Burkholderiales bacterium]
MLYNLTTYFPEEAQRIGRMVAGYSELEFGLFACIDSAHDDYDALFKAMFRTRGETQRLDVADAIGRYKFHALGLGTEFEMTLGGLRRCLTIRNQFAHSHWISTETSFAFIDMEENAKKSSLLTPKNTNFTLRYLSKELVKQQEEFFDYVNEMLIWTQAQAAHKKGVESGILGLPDKPKQLETPPLYIPQ